MVKLRDKKGLFPSIEISGSVKILIIVSFLFLIFSYLLTILSPLPDIVGQNPMGMPWLFLLPLFNVSLNPYAWLFVLIPLILIMLLISYTVLSPRCHNIAIRTSPGLSRGGPKELVRKLNNLMGIFLSLMLIFFGLIIRCSI